MREIIDRIIDEFHERSLRKPILRDRQVIEVDGKAAVIIGIRRGGKTWFCHQRMQALLREGVPMERLLYIDFEDDRLLPFAAADFQTILDTYYRKFPDLKETRCYFFLDEIQRIEGWEMFVRRILNTENVSVWVTGSSSKLLSKEIATSLRGRSISTEIFPLSFGEFLRFHRVPSPTAGRFGSRARAKLQHEADRYLELGGFPEIQSVEDADTRRQILRNYLDVALLRDVIERYSVTNVPALRSLVRHIMAAPATRFSVSKFYNTLRSRGLRCSKNNLYEYVDHLADAYLIYPTPIHSRSEKVRQVNPKKIYVVDSGLLAALSFGITADRGAFLENLVYLHLRGQGLAPEYHVSETGTEVDFVLPGRKGGGKKLIQSCWSMAKSTTKQREIGALQTAMGELGVKAATIVTWLEEGSMDEIEIVPAWKWLLRTEA